MKHTRGPWEVIDFGDGPQIDSDKGPVAVAVGYKRTRLANARLMAAAPELLKACKRLQAALLRYAGTEALYEIGDANQVVNKAEGRK